MKNLLNTLQALSDEIRLRIINLLYENEFCVCDLMEDPKEDYLKIQNLQEKKKL